MMAALVAVCWCAAWPAATRAASAVDLVVGFAPDATAIDQVHELADAGVGGATVTSVARADIPQLDAVIVSVPAAEAAAIRRELAAADGVRYVEVEGRARMLEDPAVEPAPTDAGPAPEAVPTTDSGEPAGPPDEPAWVADDPLLPRQWALTRLGAASAWQLTRGTGALIAVVDTGVDASHPDLAGRVQMGRDFVDGDDDSSDVQGHGTHVAGIAGASAGDGYGIAGMAPASTILAVRVLDAQGGGDYSWVASGIVHAADRGADVINLSLGGGTSSELLRSAVDYASAKGAVVTCASGNEAATQLGFPARYANCVAIGATTSADVRAAFSNTGVGLDFAAPGQAILSTVMPATHQSWSGTSMAAPYASGVAALLASQGLSRTQVLAAMRATSHDLGSPGWDVQFGAGRLDAAAAVDTASRMPRGAPDVTAPAVSMITLDPIVARLVRTKILVWRVDRVGNWGLVGRTPFPGLMFWSTTKTVGNVRLVSSFRASRGIVKRRDVRMVRVAVIRTTTSRQLPVRVAASDDAGVERVALEVDGRIAAVDWTARDGWSFLVPCRAGTHTFTAWAYDVADNEHGGRTTRSVAC